MIMFIAAWMFEMQSCSDVPTFLFFFFFLEKGKRTTTLSGKVHIFFICELVQLSVININAVKISVNYPFGIFMYFYLDRGSRLRTRPVIQTSNISYIKQYKNHKTLSWWLKGAEFIKIYIWISDVLSEESSEQCSQNQC